MTGNLSGIGHYFSGYVTGQVQPRTISLTVLNTELQNLTTNEARRALILRYFGRDGTANLSNLSGYTRNTLISVFNRLKEILESGNINIDNAARARGFRFLSGLAVGINENIRNENPLDENALRYEQYEEAYRKLSDSLNAISRLPSIQRNGNTLVIPSGTFSNLPYNMPPEGITFNPETPAVRRLVQSSLFSAINSLPQNTELRSPDITEENHEAVEKDFEMLQQMVTEIGNGIILGSERRNYIKLLQLCKSYAEKLSRYYETNGDNVKKDHYNQLAVNYNNLLQRMQRLERESAPYDGPELNNPEHRLTSLRNRIRSFQTQLQNTTAESERTSLRRALLMELFGEGAPNCPRIEDFFHRRTGSEVFYELQAIVENFDIDIPLQVRARAFRFLSAYADAFAGYTDRNREGEETDPTTLRFCEYSTTYQNIAGTIESLNGISHQINEAESITLFDPVRVRIGTFLGMPYRLTDLESNNPANGVESHRLKRLMERMLVRIINNGISKSDGGSLFRVSDINNEEDLRKAIIEFNNLRRLAMSISMREGNSPETLRALPHIWSLCNRYAISIMTYCSNNDREQASLYSLYALDCTCEGHLSRTLSETPLSYSSHRSSLNPASLTPNLVTLETMLQRATDPQKKIDFIRRLFESRLLILASPSNLSGYHPRCLERLFNGIKNILEDPALNIDISTRMRGFRFLSQFSENYARVFPANSDNARRYLRYSQTYGNVANDLEMLAQLPQGIAQLAGQVLITRLFSESNPPVQLAQVSPPIQTPPPMQIPPPMEAVLPMQPPVNTVIPAGDVGNVEVTLHNGQTTELTNYISGLPSQRQRDTYQRVIRFTYSGLIPPESFTHTGGNIQPIQTTNGNDSSINIPGVCFIHARRGEDGNYTYLIGVYNNFNGNILIGNRISFNNN